MLKRTFLRSAAAAMLVAVFSSSAWADRLITDQIGREVKIPDQVNRVVVLQHQTLNLLVQLNASEKVVGILSTWKKNLGPEFARFDKRFETMPMPGSLKSANVEEIMALKPDVVFVTNYAPKDMISSLEEAGLPVVAVSLRRDAESEKAKLNPTMKDEDWSYTMGLQDGIRLIADVVDRKSQGEELIRYTMEKRKLTENRIRSIKPADRVSAYMANPNLTTYGSGKYTGLMMQRSGAYNVAAATIKGFKQVSIEQVMQWNPSVIFVQDRYPKVVKEILADPSWSGISAVKTKRVYLMPEYAKAWGYPEPEAFALGELWMAKKLYPAKFADIDMDKVADEYYTKFYRTHWNAGDNKH